MPPEMRFSQSVMFDGIEVLTLLHELKAPGRITPDQADRLRRLKAAGAMTAGITADGVRIDVELSAQYQRLEAEDAS